jgi:hypothetical protein
MAAHPKITPDKVEQVIAALRIGADIAGAAHLIAVSTSGLERYMVRHPLVKVRADEARKIADDRVQSALYKSAVAGNVTAMIFWLKNRQPKEWRDRREIEMSGAGDVADAIATAHAALLKGPGPGS